MKKRRHFWIIALLCLAAILLLWSSFPPFLLRHPVHFTRAANGVMHPAVENTIWRKAFFSLNISHANIHQKSSFSTWSPSLDTSHYWSYRHIAVVNQSKHRLGQLVCERLVTLLAANTLIDQLDYYPQGFTAREGDIVPDLFVTINVAGVTHQSGIFTYSNKGHVSLFVGNSLTGNAGVTTQFPHWIPNFNWYQNGTADFTNDASGIESPVLRYREEANGVAKAIAKELLTSFRQQQLENTTTSPLPGAFTPAYHPAPVLPFIPKTATLLYALHGLFCPTDICWQLTTPSAQNTMRQLAQQLQAGGWKSQGSNGMVNSTLSFLKDNQTIDLNALAGHTFVRYRVWMSPTEIEQAFVQNIKSPASGAVAMLFAARLQPALAASMLALLNATPPHTAKGWLALTNVYQQAGRIEEARVALRCTSVISMSLHELDEMKNAIQRKSTELGYSHSSKLTFLDVCKRCGFHRFPATPAPTSVTISTNEPAVFYLLAPDKQLYTYAVQFFPSKDANFYYSTSEYCYTFSKPYTSCWFEGACSGSDAGNYYRNKTATVNVRQTKYGPKFSVKVN